MASFVKLASPSNFKQKFGGNGITDQKSEKVTLFGQIWTKSVAKTQLMRKCNIAGNLPRAQWEFKEYICTWIQVIQKNTYSPGTKDWDVSIIIAPPSDLIGWIFVARVKGEISKVWCLLLEWFQRSKYFKWKGMERQKQLSEQKEKCFSTFCLDPQQ